MKIVTWNVNSLKARQDYVASYLDRVAPDVLCIQELKLEEEKIPREIFESRGYHLAIHAQRQWNGVLIASKSPIEATIAGLPSHDEGEARLVAAHTAGLWIVDVYVPQGQSVDSPKFPYKLKFLDGVLAFLSERFTPETPLVLLGDINVAPADRDIYAPAEFLGVPSFHPDEHRRFQALLDWGLRDPVASRVAPGTYSFWDYRGGAFRFNQGMRIDHVLVTAPVDARVSSAFIARDVRKKRGELPPSDHAPVGITLD